MPNICFGFYRAVEYRYAQHKDVSVDDEPHIRRWSHKIIILYYIIIYYNTYHCVTIAYRIPYIYDGDPIR